MIPLAAVGVAVGAVLGLVERDVVLVVGVGVAVLDLIGVLVTAVVGQSDWHLVLAAERSSLYGLQAEETMSLLLFVPPEQVKEILFI